MATPLAHRDAVMPTDASAAVLVGRVLDPEVGPSVVTVRGDTVVDITAAAPTTSDLLDHSDPVDLARSAATERSWSLDDLLESSLTGDRTRPHLLAPFDLQVIKAAGVTFAKSMLERVIEENAKGDPTRANDIRQHLSDVVGGAIAQVTPGTPEAARVKEVLAAEGLWSQYLEVGIGPDPEIFTKAPVLAAVGAGAPIGVLERSTWNNPEPEMVLVADAAGRAVAATLGNDVNLRDFEGRSALLLTEAKDNNASCAVGPFLRLFDDGFTLEDAAGIDVQLTVAGTDGFTLEAVSSVAEMSRTPTELLEHAWGAHHRYPDGFVLFTGTMFAPTKDRRGPGQGFTHERGDVVTISSPKLGMLVNTVDTAEAAPDWTVGIRAFTRNLAARGLLAGETPAAPTTGIA